MRAHGANQQATGTSVRKGVGKGGGGGERGRGELAALGSGGLPGVVRGATTGVCRGTGEARRATIYCCAHVRRPAHPRGGLGSRARAPVRVAARHPPRRFQHQTRRPAPPELPPPHARRP
eukprot:scaffold300794_cov30-Tisochrysis_lutea.AAC.2